ncbi:hypothetical protein BOX15_Mlig022209g1 [Macrostomum lignano]|uniref:Uncharacterized protein n=1 Tax=Macrostomum lignano TaxID=282301 RepID=A0A267DYL6_9PLAT|nr:hypothetical protein BOX15_Mlig022209g1 [Macrostomum lignano]
MCPSKDSSENDCCGCCPRRRCLLGMLIGSIFITVLSIILLVVDLNTSALGGIGGYVMLGVSLVMAVAMLTVTVVAYKPDACPNCCRGGDSQTWPATESQAGRTRQARAAPVQRKGGEAGGYPPRW